MEKKVLETKLCDLAEELLAREETLLALETEADEGDEDEEEVEEVAELEEPIEKEELFLANACFCNRSSASLLRSSISLLSS